MGDLRPLQAYTDRKSIYSGPFCDIYKCKTTSQETVALKVVDLDFLHKPHNFRREVAFMQRLSHPNIARFIDSFACGEDHYMVMDYYELDLNSVLAHFSTQRMKFNLEDPTKYHVVKTNGLPTDEIGPMVWSLVRALEFVHKSGIIHRDIKPANIFFKNLDSLGSPVIGDFGISYDTRNPPSDEPSDKKYTDVCTGYYKAPELCFGVTDYDFSIDYWSLGILLSVLYSRDGNPANFVKADPDDPDKSPEINDFVLILGIFNAFGTPDIVDSSSELYWEKLGREEYHFGKFQYRAQPRKLTGALIPRCDDHDIQALFEGLTKYDGRKLIGPPK